MDSKFNENSIKKSDEKSLEKLQSKTIFNNPAYLFIYKKTEKIVAALYIITNLISDTEPIKSQIRKVSLGLVSDILNIKRLSSTLSKQSTNAVAVSISELVSLLKVAAISDHVSTMNYNVVQKELSLLMGHLESIDLNNVSDNNHILTQDYFNVPEPLPTSAPVLNHYFHDYAPKGQYRTSNPIKDNQGSNTQKDNQKDNRHEKMLQLLKAGRPLGIKDFVREIKDCSEKTLQRELLAMVESGVLKKTGERRWSLYSLA